VILAVVSDLMFSVQIGDMAKRLGVPAAFATDRASALAKLAGHPKVVVLDLNLEAADPVGLLRSLRADPAWAAIPTIGFVPHVRVDLKQAALEAGCGVVLARSVFAEKLPGLLRQYIG
jgi:CheY-like chemotaxis protein